MEWIMNISIAIAFIIVGFLLFVFMPKPQVFFDPYVEEIHILNDNFTDIKKEIDEFADLNPVIPIYGNGIVKDLRFKKLYELLRCIPHIRYVGLLNIKPKFEQKKQYGYARIADDTIRFFYTIKQSSALKSGIWVDGAKKFFKENEWICADVSREHSLFNKNKKNYSTVLFLDIDRISGKGNSPNLEIDEILSVFF
jgi:hypothetical protein